jgi:hypothetical protein
MSKIIRRFYTDPHHNPNATNRFRLALVIGISFAICNLSFGIQIFSAVSCLRSAVNYFP